MVVRARNEAKKFEKKGRCVGAMIPDGMSGAAGVSVRGDAFQRVAPGTSLGGLVSESSSLHQEAVFSGRPRKKETFGDVMRKLRLGWT